MDADKSPIDYEDFFATLAQNVGPEHVITDKTALSPYGKDIYYESKPPIAVVRPGTIKEVCSTVQTITAAGLCLSARGGGLSYSAGYLTDRQDCVTLDMQRLNEIIEINQDDMYVRVQAGVTWNQLNDALEPLGLRTPFWGTGSGLFATVGGGISQNAINYGSGRYGTLAESVIGLRLVMANGEELRTGSWAAEIEPSPFNRYYGPDLTGLFLGDSGALGVKTEVALQLIPRPTEVRFAAFSFADRNDFAAATGAVGRLGLVSECFGLDPFFLSERIASTGFADDVDKLLGIAKGQSSILRGMKEAFKVAAAGRRYLKDVGYTLHMSVDGRNDADADTALETVKDACTTRNGREIEASIPKVMRGTPFPPPIMMLGPKGDRWVPMHGILPHSLHATLLDDIDVFMNSNKDVIERHGLVWGQVSNLIGQSRVLIEVNLYWKDRRTDMIESYLDDDFLKTRETFDADPAAHAAVGELRKGLANLFRKRGGTHMQIGRSYPFLESRMDTAADLLKTLKKTVDPNNLINPGALGL
ncbi:MAG: FAD-binding oxidoreductase [Rhodospirillaceae bacterium]|jgi:FAD/FMN-containing dehydrogenase|nr:FAD-binding oxidoreductase [Rhodospirillaceae bacterium]MBT5242528.1 FAD-binding oxidoreductase [Rhodospirillaceae bacterium]MBT5565558.1 FAD-binding oxidoreductase [Rhodospirillaceae bacterium]MBT6088327.1 FAD-binding oxidoreductase [Rhodospirillaceae bacterium]MBT7449571.1 FAD-binding oxidoreductase [Rhodospirillaceae bacterium]